MFSSTNALDWDLLPESFQTLLVQRTSLSEEETESIQRLLNQFRHWVGKPSYFAAIRDYEMPSLKIYANIDKLREKLHAIEAFQLELASVTALITEQLERQLRETDISLPQVDVIRKLDIEREEQEQKNAFFTQEQQAIKEAGDQWIRETEEKLSQEITSSLKDRRLQIAILKAQIERERLELTQEQSESEALENFLTQLGVSDER